MVVWRRQEHYGQTEHLTDGPLEAVLYRGLERQTYESEAVSTTFLYSNMYKLLKEIAVKSMKNIVSRGAVIKWQKRDETSDMRKTADLHSSWKIQRTRHNG